MVLVAALAVSLRYLVGLWGQRLSPLLTPLLLIGQDAAMLAGVWYFGLRKYRVGRQALGLRPFETPLGCGLAALGLPAALAFNVFYAVVFSMATGRAPQQQAILPIFGGGLLGLALALLSASIVAPFAEELAFRGFLFAGLARRLGTAGGAVLSALIFGAIHRSVEAFIPLTIFGLVLALLYRSARSLYPSIIVHSVNNSLVLLVAFVIERGPGPA